MNVWVKSFLAGLVLLTGLLGLSFLIITYPWILLIFAVIVTLGGFTFLARAMFFE